MTGNITVPRAGTTAGRAPDLASKVYTPQTGAMIAQLGETVMQAGVAWAEDKAKRELDRAQVDYTRDLNDLRLKAMEIGDPDALDAFWAGNVKELRARYAAGMSDRNRDRFELGFDATANQVGFGVGKDVLAARQSVTEANWLAYEAEAVRAAAQGDQSTRAHFIAEGETRIEQMVADGTISADEGQKRKLGLAASADNAAAIQAVAVDPAGFLADLDAGVYANLDGEAQARYKVTAQTALTQLQEAQARAAEQEAKERVKEAGAWIDTAIGVITKGRTFTDIGRITDPDIKDHPDFAKLEAAIQLQQDQPGFAQMTIADLDALIAEEKTKAIPSTAFAARLDLLTETRDRLAKGYTTDAVATMQEAGLPVPKLPDFDPANPGAYAKGLRARAVMAEQAVADGRITAPAIFNADELKAAQERFGPKGDPRERAAWIETMNATLGDAAPGFVKAASGDAISAFAAGLLARGGDPRTVSDILAGQRRVTDKTVVLPARNDFVLRFGVTTAEELRDQFGFTPAAIDAALFLYAEAGGDPEEIDETIFDRAVQRAMGATPDADGNYEVGGLQRFGGRRDGYYVDLPTGVDKSDVETALTGVARMLYNEEQSDRGLNDLGADAGGALGVLSSISVSGEAPDLGAPAAGESLTDRFQDYRLGSIWGDGENGQPTGHYVFYRERNGRRDYLMTEAGTLYRFRLEDLVREAR